MPLSPINLAGFGLDPLVLQQFTEFALRDPLQAAQLAARNTGGPAPDVSILGDQGTLGQLALGQQGVAQLPGGGNADALADAALGKLPTTSAPSTPAAGVGAGGSRPPSTGVGATPAQAAFTEPPVPPLLPLTPLPAGPNPQAIPPGSIGPVPVPAPVAADPAGVDTAAAAAGTAGLSSAEKVAGLLRALGNVQLPEEEREPSAPQAPRAPAPTRGGQNLDPQLVAQLRSLLLSNVTPGQQTLGQLALGR